MALAASVAMLVAGCFPSQPDTTIGGLSGTLLSTAGTPVRGTRVSVGGTETITGSDGRFFFGELPQGDLEVALGEANQNSFEIDSLLGDQNNNLTISVDGQGGFTVAQMTRVGGTTSRGEAIHRLTRPIGAPDTNARGKVEIEEESSGDEELKIKISHLDPGSIFDVFLQHDILDPTSMELIGSITIHSDGDGKLKFDTDHGDALPFGAELEQLFGLRVEIRLHGSTALYLEGSVPPGLPAMGGKQKGELELTNVGAPAGAEAEIEIKSKPRKHDERFIVELEDVDPYTTYLVCVECGARKANAAAAAPAFNWSPAARDDRPSAIEATLSLPNVTAAANAIIEIPVKVQTVDDMTFMSFVIEYSSTHLHFLGAVPGVDAVAGGFTDIAFNTNPGFAPASLDSHVVVQVSHPSGNVSLPGMNSPLEIARLRFQVGNLPGTSAPILWDRSVPPGLPRTFVEITPNRTLTGEDPLAFIDGSITITGGGGPGEFDCIGSITTDDEGEGELKIKNKNGDRLPCGVEYVGDLQYLAGGDRHVVVHLNDENGPIVFQGRVPRFGEDEDHDHEHHHH